MNNHSSNSDVQHYGCAALQNLAYDNKNNQVMISNAGGKVAIESAVQNHSSNADVQAKGNGALLILTATPNPTTSISLKIANLFSSDNNNLTIAEAGVSTAT